METNKKQLIKDYKGIHGTNGKTFIPSSPKSISSLLKEERNKTMRKDIKKLLEKNKIRIYLKCKRCGKEVWVNKKILGSLHICDDIKSVGK